MGLPQDLTSRGAASSSYADVLGLRASRAWRLRRDAFGPGVSRTRSDCPFAARNRTFRYEHRPSTSRELPGGWVRRATASRAIAARPWLRPWGVGMSDREQLSEAADSREHLLELLEDALDEAHRKASNGRVYDAENEKTRQGWFRTLGYLTGQYRQLLNDAELDEMQERLDALEQANGPTASTPATVATDGGSDE